MASRIPNRSRTNRRDEEPEAIPTDEQATEDEGTDFVEGDEGNLPIAVAPLDVSAATQVAAARRPWYENLPGWIPSYFREAIIELNKVTWPTPQEALRLSTIVVVFAVIFGIVFFLLDSGLSSILQVLITRLTK